VPDPFGKLPQDPFFPILNRNKHCPSSKQEDQILFPARDQKPHPAESQFIFMTPAAKAQITTLKWGFASSIMISGLQHLDSWTLTAVISLGFYIPGLRKGGRCR
jgi:hypothetical protein